MIQKPAFPPPTGLIIPWPDKNNIPPRWSITLKNIPVIANPGNPHQQPLQSTDWCWIQRQPE
jgi:hypothetical protein